MDFSHANLFALIRAHLREHTRAVWIGDLMPCSEVSLTSSHHPSAMCPPQPFLCTRPVVAGHRRPSCLQKGNVRRAGTLLNELLDYPGRSFVSITITFVIWTTLVSIRFLPPARSTQLGALTASRCCSIDRASRVCCTKASSLSIVFVPSVPPVWNRLIVYLPLGGLSGALIVPSYLCGLEILRCSCSVLSFHTVLLVSA
jgi:hypothetical protein